jgi:ATP-dependent protease ClpP protease subunit
MPKNKDYKVIEEQAQKDLRAYLPQSLMARWQPEVHAANDDDESILNIYDVIGYDYWTDGGITDSSVTNFLKRNKGKDVTININSPGGDFFQGLAIYNILKEHDGEVTTRVIALAGSAASIIAMAGTKREIAESAFFMIHNAWSVCVGNRKEMLEKADTLEKLDASMVGIYAKHSNYDKEKIIELVDAESWINADDSLAMGLATALIDDEQTEVDESEEAKHNASLKEIDLALAKAGKTRSQRREIIKDFTSKPSARSETVIKSGANDDWLDELSSLSKTLKEN